MLLLRSLKPHGSLSFPVICPDVIYLFTTIISIATLSWQMLVCSIGPEVYVLVDAVLLAFDDFVIVLLSSPALTFALHQRLL
jgi:hypothetical protein